MQAVYEHEPNLNGYLSIGSVQQCQFALNIGNWDMLARRFTIVCLIATLFAMGMIAVIENSARPAYSLKIDNSIPCVWNANRECQQG